MHKYEIKNRIFIIKILFLVENFLLDIFLHDWIREILNFSIKCKYVKYINLLNRFLRKLYDVIEFIRRINVEI